MVGYVIEACTSSSSSSSSLLLPDRALQLHCNTMRCKSMQQNVIKVLDFHGPSMSLWTMLVILSLFGHALFWLFAAHLPLCLFLFNRHRMAMAMCYQSPRMVQFSSNGKNCPEDLDSLRCNAMQCSAMYLYTLVGLVLLYSDGEDDFSAGWRSGCTKAPTFQHSARVSSSQSPSLS